MVMNRCICTQIFRRTCTSGLHTQLAWTHRWVAHTCGLRRLHTRLQSRGFSVHKINYNKNRPLHPQINPAANPAVPTYIHTYTNIHTHIHTYRDQHTWKHSLGSPNVSIFISLSFAVLKSARDIHEPITGLHVTDVAFVCIYTRTINNAVVIEIQAFVNSLINRWPLDLHQPLVTL